MPLTVVQNTHPITYLAFSLRSTIRSDSLFADRVHAPRVQYYQTAFEFFICWTSGAYLAWWCLLSYCHDFLLRHSAAERMATCCTLMAPALNDTFTSSQRARIQYKLEIFYWWRHCSTIGSAISKSSLKHRPQIRWSKRSGAKREPVANIDERQRLTSRCRHD